METRANYILIGVFTILGVLGVLGFFIWLAKVEIDRQYTQYDILFESVSGLGRAGDVRFNGLSVGQVLDLSLYEADPNKVRVRIEVDAATPVKTDTVAQMQAQGVTGVSFVSLTGGSPDTPLLYDPVSGRIPFIPAERSVVQALTEDAPDLVSEAIALMKDLQNFAGPENQDYVGNILQNLDRASGQLDKALADFSLISQRVADGTAEISRFTGRLDEIGAAVQTTLQAANNTLDVASKAIVKAEATLETATDALSAAKGTFGNADAFITDQMPQITRDLSAAIQSVDTAVSDVTRQVSDVMARFGNSADLANKRLVDLQTTLADLDQTLEGARQSFSAVENASTSFQTLVDGEGAALVADARTTFANIEGSITALDRVVTQDVPAITSDIRAAVDTANRVITQVGNDVTGFTEKLDPLVTTGDSALQTATETLQNASRTLAKIDDAITTVERTLVAAEKTFTESNQIISTDIGPAMADIRTAANQFEQTMEAVSLDVPTITQDLRQAIERTTDVIDQIRNSVAKSAPPLQNFAESGLPQFTRFAREAQDLVDSLDKLTKRLERDPVRFFFGNTPSEFRR